MPDFALLLEAVSAEKAARAVERDRKGEAEGSLLEFVRLFWPVVEPNTKLVEGWPVELLCDALEAVSDGHQTRMVINVPPGFMKSSILNIFLPAWEWGPRNMPHLRYLSCSYSTDVPERDNERLLRLIQSPLYRRLWGDRFSLTGTGVQHLRNDKTGWKRASPLVGTAGWRGDRLLLDDLNDPFQTESTDIRDKINRWLTETASDRINSADSAIVLIQQRTHESDATDTLARRGTGYTWIVVPMEFDPWRSAPVPLRYLDDGEPDPEWIWRDPRSLDEDGRPLRGWAKDRTGKAIIRPGSPLAMAEGELAWPERFDEEFVQAQKLIKGPYAWCTPAESPILMADLSMRPIGQIREGNRIVGWETDVAPRREGDRHARRRLMPVDVIAVHRSVRPVVKITLDSGKIIRCTADHRWYTGRSPNDASHPVYAPAKVGRALMRVCDPELPSITNPEELRLAGWLGGFFDGEGTVSLQNRRHAHGEERVLSIEPDGEEEVFGLTTTSGNYVVWGIASSNSGQYSQSPTPRGGGIIRRDWWKPWLDENGEPAKRFPDFGTVIVSVDTSLGMKQENDYNAVTKWGAFAHGDEGAPQLMLIAAWKERLPLADLVLRVNTTCNDRPAADYLVIENKTRGQDLRDEIIREYGKQTFQIELMEPVGDKVSRMHAASPMFSGDRIRKPIPNTDPVEYLESYQGGMIWAPETDWAEEVIEEVTSFPRAAHDDYADSTSQAVIWVRRNGVLVRKTEWTDSENEAKRFRKPIRVPYAI